MSFRPRSYWTRSLKTMQQRRRHRRRLRRAYRRKFGRRYR